MSHEIRTPLNAIVGFSEVLLDRTTIEIPESQRKVYLEHIHSSALHLLNLVNDVLDLSKVEAGRMELQLEPVAVDDLIHGCVGVIGGVASQRNLAFEVDVQPGDGVISADRGRLKQVLYNLLSNAVKFTPDGGQITVSSRIHDGQAVISISDTGTGIDVADQALIFEPFHQGRPGVATGVGTGLGLALVRNLVAAHGGSVEVESAPGHGSTFRVCLPVVHTCPPEQRSANVVADDLRASE
jgi:signal transduction histidine kinase